jgi:hypothetical protein
VCEVAPSSFYAWVAAQAAGPDEATLAEAYLANRIHDIWTGSRRRYGVPRVTAQLWREGVRINRKRVARLMCLVGIQGTCGRRKVVTTRRDPTATPAPDLVQRQFEQLCLDQLYVGDITYYAEPVIMPSSLPSKGVCPAQGGFLVASCSA